MKENKERKQEGRGEEVEGRADKSKQNLWEYEITKNRTR